MGPVPDEIIPTDPPPGDAELFAEIERFVAGGSTNVERQSLLADLDADRR